MRKFLSALAVCAAALTFSLRATAGTPIEDLLLRYSTADEDITYAQFVDDEIPLAMMLLSLRSDGELDFSEQTDSMHRLSFFVVKRGDVADSTVNAFLGSLNKTLADNYILLDSDETAKQYMGFVKDEKDRAEVVVVMETEESIIVIDMILSTAD